MTLRAAVFASGTGSNFQVLADHATSLWEVALLISDQREAPALNRAHERGIPSLCIPVSGRDPAEVERDTLEALGAAGIDFVLLAGYMRLIPPRVVARYRGKMLNLHPALLPAFGGKGMYGRHVHEAVLAAGVRVTGVTVHRVDEVYDRGEILAQWPVAVLPGDTPDTLAARIHEVEHRVFPAAADALARALRAGGDPRPIPRGAGHFHLGEGVPVCAPLLAAPVPPHDFQNPDPIEST